MYRIDVTYADGSKSSPDERFHSRSGAHDWINADLQSNPLAVLYSIIWDEPALAAAPRAIENPAARAAAAAIRSIAPHRRELDPVTFADRTTSMCDLRTALCIAHGVPMDDIDSASGYNISRDAYERSRASYRREIADCGGVVNDYLFADVVNVVARWTSRRPEFTAGDDWFAGFDVPDYLKESA